MKNLLTVLLIGLISISVYAEKIDGPANIRMKPKGELRFSLNDQVQIECTAIRNDWYEVMVTIRLTEEQYSTIPLVLKKGTTLIDMQGKEIGETLADLTIVIKEVTIGESDGNPMQYKSKFSGFTYKSNIRPESIVEPVLSEIVRANNSNLNLDVFESHMTEFNYEEGIEIPDYAYLKTYMIHEYNGSDPSLLDRIRLVFDFNELIAIVHSRELALADYKTYPIARGRKLTIIKQFSEERRTDFIEKNKQAYWGVD